MVRSVQDFREGVVQCSGEVMGYLVLWKATPITLQGHTHHVTSHINVVKDFHNVSHFDTLENICHGSIHHKMISLNNSDRAI